MARGRPPKVTKTSGGSGNSTRHGSRQPRRIPSFASTAQDQLEQIAQLSTVVQDGDVVMTKDGDRGNSVDNSINTTPASSFDAPTIFSNGASFSSTLNDPLDPALHSSFRLDEMMMPDGRNAAQVALETFGAGIKIDSALCKKLATELALRPPTQRRTEQRLNIERRSNVEAVLCHITGQISPRQCKNCHKGHGPWTQCVVLEGQMCGSCSNCWFNASGARCTFHENNNNNNNNINNNLTMFGPVPFATIPNPLSSQLGSVSVPSLVSTPTLFHSSETSSQSPTGIPGSRSMSLAFLNNNNTNNSNNNNLDIDPQAFALVADAMAIGSGLSEKQRHITRVETAAKELAIRIADYQAFLQTTEGSNDEPQPSQHQILEQIHSQSSDQSVNGKASPAPSALLG
ncbi:hypothetical protein BGZ63DRAFT_455443 [Mariannaea sp. PMI_226]|nr:hypothetical protein BGZ63DRAFT_455443 [Mariannaea sp. PMI_226]